LETKAIEEVIAALPRDPNIGRMYTGWGVGIEAFASPIWAQAILPPLMTWGMVSVIGRGVGKVRGGGR
jgi:hypothetical protein